MDLGFIMALKVLLCADYQFGTKQYQDLRQGAPTMITFFQVCYTGLESCRRRDPPEAIRYDGRVMH
jgi:hypothetical protein